MKTTFCTYKSITLFEWDEYTYNLYVLDPSAPSDRGRLVFVNLILTKTKMHYLQNSSSKTFLIAYSYTTA